MTADRNEAAATVEVLFCGAGDAFCSGGQLQAGYLVQTPGTQVLLDCGVTTLAALHRHRVDVAAIDWVFLSHLHGDHFGGLPFLFLEWIYASPRTRPLHILGPPGTADRVRTLFRTLYRDVGSRELPFVVRYRELQPDEVVDLPAGWLQPFSVPHQRDDISFGVTVYAGGKKIVYSGDTGWTDDLLRRVAGANLFICECSFFATVVPHHLAYTTLEAMRSQLECESTVLTHLGRDVLANRHRVRFPLAHDGMSVVL